MKKFRSIFARERWTVRLARRTMYVTGAVMAALQLLSPALFPPRVSSWWSRELQLLAFGLVVYGLTSMVTELRLKFPRYYFYKTLDEKIMKMLGGQEPGPRCSVQITLIDPDGINVRAHELMSMPPDLSDAQRAHLAALLAREKKEWTN